LKLFQLKTILNLFGFDVQVEHGVHPPGHAVCREVRRYAVVALTNLTFGNTGIKSYLCQVKEVIEQTYLKFGNTDIP
jgi:hypothetical protein